MHHMPSQLPVYDFQHKVAVVTGGLSGIGAAIVARLQQCGAQVVVWDLNASTSNLSGAHAMKVDVTREDSVAHALADCVSRFGRVDFLINSAGWAGPTMLLDEFALDVWNRVLNVNLNGVFLTCRAVTPVMRSQGFGRIVNIASLAGKEGTPNASAYSAAKAGVLALTKSLGKELATHGVRVNAIAPAAIDTPLLAQMSPEHVQIMVNKSPQQRLGTVSEVSEMTMWLCSDACSFNSGAVFDLSGGRATY
jgi:NAD(P)-dependent dehydrogenase (short-subunit alcohol dehydrogenase family)